MASFAKDLRTQIKIPSVQAPDPSKNVTTAQDIASLATFGLQLKQRSDAKDAEANRQKRVTAIDTAVLGASNAITEMKGQGREVTSTDIARVSARFSSEFTSPTDALAFQEGLGTSMSSPLFKNIIGDDLDSVATTKASTRLLSNEAQVLAQDMFKVNDINELPDELIGEYEKVARTFQANIDKIKTSKTTFMGTPTSKAFNDYLSTSMNGSLDLMAGNLRDTITDIKRLGLESTQTKELVQQVRGTMSGVIDGNLAEAERLALQSSKGSGEKEHKRIMDTLKVAKEYWGGIKSSYNNMSDLQFTDTLQVMNDLQNNIKINASKSFPQMMTLNAALGGNADAILTKLLVISGNDEVVEKVFMRELEHGLANSGRNLNIGTAAQVAQGVTLYDLTAIFEGKSVNEEALEDRKSAIANRWITMDEYIKDPQTIAQFTETQMDRFGISMIEILKTAEEDGGEEDIANASTMLSSKAFGSYMDKLAKTSPIEAETLTRYVASSTALTFEKQFRFDPEMTYDATVGGGTIKIPVKVSNLRATQSKNERTIQGIKDNERQIINKNSARVRKAVAANKKLNSAAKTLAKHNPFLKGDERAAKDYLMSFVPAAQVTGFRRDFSSEEQSAVANGVSQVDFTAGVDALSRLKTIAKDAAQISEDSVARKAGFQSEDDIKQKEQAELIKQLKDPNTSKEVKLQLIEELSK